ncbi:MAG: ribonuclease III [Candidatus Goldbacteria bacterium]|nr:ribonuclease III [Candidatus Goldiibacteriota bacterium]
MVKKYIEEYLKKNLIYDSSEVKRALTHSSYDINNYEKLEFLGDAVLGLVINEFIYEKMKEMKVGELAKIKSYLVSREVLFRIGTKYNIIKLLKTGQALKKKEIKKNKKIISDVMEAIVGAVYIKLGLQKVKEFIFEIYKDELKNLNKKKDFDDYKSKLQIKFLENYGVLPEYSLIKTEGEEHKKIFYVNVKMNNKVMGKGKGMTIKEAEQMAAKDCLKKL